MKRNQHVACMYRPHGSPCREYSMPGSPYCDRCAKLSARTKQGRAMKKLCAGEVHSVSLVPTGPKQTRLVVVQGISTMTHDGVALLRDWGIEEAK